MTGFFCAWKLICAIHHGLSLHSKWTESREKLGYQSLLFQQAALRGGESAPFLRAATVSYRGCLEQTLHYINPDRKGKKRVGATKALFQYFNLEVLKIIRQWGQNNQRVERDGFWFSHNVTNILSDMLMHCNAGCEKPCINWDKVACKEHAEFFSVTHVWWLEMIPWEKQCLLQMNKFHA